MMTSQQRVERRIARRTGSRKEWLKNAARAAGMGLLISLAYVGWVGLFLFSTFDLA